MEEIKLPSHKACEDAHFAGGVSALQEFIYFNEPAGMDEEKQFREGLSAILAEQVGKLKTDLAETKEEKTCKWKSEFDDMADTWETECGEIWLMLEGGLADNKVKFCPYCGHKIVEQVPKREEAK